MKTKRALSILLTFCILISAFCIMPFSASASGRVNTVYLKPHQIILQQFAEFPGAYFHVTYMSAEGMGEFEMQNVDNEHFKADINRIVDILEFRLKDSEGNELWMSHMICEGSSFNCANFTDDPLQGTWSQYSASNPPTEGGGTKPPVEGGGTESTGISILFLLPCEAWINTQGTYKARFMLKDGTEMWENMNPAGNGGLFSVVPPNDFTRVTFCVLPEDAANHIDKAIYRSDTFTTTVIGGNCLVLNEPAGTNKVTKGTWTNETVDESGSGASNAEVIWGVDADNLTERGTLRDALAKNNVYIKLLRDIMVDTPIGVGGNKTLDLAGNRILFTMPGTKITVQGMANFTITDALNPNKSNPGTIEGFNDENSDSAYMFIIYRDSLLNICGGEFITYDTGIVSLAEESSMLHITGGTLKSKRNNHLINLYRGLVEIDGGSFISGAELDMDRETRLGALCDVDINSGRVILSKYDDSLDPFSVRKFTENDVPCELIYSGEKYHVSDAQGNILHGNDLSKGKIYIFSERKTVNYYDDVNSENVILSEEQPKYGKFVLCEPDFLTTPESMEFSHWMIGENAYNPGDEVFLSDLDDVVDIYPVWRRMVQYDVTYHANDGTETAFTQKEWNTFSLPEFPSDWQAPEGYEFAGWAETPDGGPLTGEVKIDDNTDYYAIYYQKSYFVTYYGNGGDKYTFSIEAKYYFLDYYIIDKVPTRTGYTFIGWAESEDGEVKYRAGDKYTENKELNLYAIWEIMKYTVSFEAEGAENVPESQTKTHGVSLVLSSLTPKKEGHIFKGWTETEGSFANYDPGDRFVPNRNTTLYAVWELEKYDVSYEVNGGSNAPESQTKTYGISLNLSGNIPVKKGYTFKGWADTENGEVKYQPGDSFEVNRETTLYAVWKIEEFSINKYDENTKTATILIPNAGTYTVVFADYDGERLANIEFISVTVAEVKAETVTLAKNFNLIEGDKIMLLDSMMNMKPLCETYIVK